MKKIGIAALLFAFAGPLAAETPCVQDKPCQDTPVNPYAPPPPSGSAFPPAPGSFPPLSPPSPFPTTPYPNVGQPPVSTSSTTLAPLPDVELSPGRLQTQTEHYPTGEMLAQRRTFDGKLDGLSQEYYKNGQVMNEWSYSLGLLEGESRSFYRTGDLKTSWRYKKGKLDGETRQYYLRNVLKSVESYKEGLLVRRKAYAPDGRPLSD